MASPVLECKLLTEGAKAPVRATNDAAGYDLYGVKCEYDDSSNTKNPLGIVDTGIAVQIPHGYCGIIKARSSYAKRYGMNILAGVIDADYQGEIKVLFTTMHFFQFQAGERFAQMLIVPVFTGDVSTVDKFSREETDRTGGFGSTGNKEI